MKIQKFNDREYEVTFTNTDYWPDGKVIDHEKAIRDMLTSSVALKMGFNSLTPIISVVRKNNSNSWIVTCQ